MIIFKSVRYKNFLSTGNFFTEINLNETKSTLVVGQNGAGKSTMLDAISFALFSKPHRNINKSQLVNSINQKACVVEVEFSIGSSAFKIVRGIRPGIFEIWKNGTMINQSSHAKEYQKILEQNILKLNHKSFHQVIVLGSSSFIPFMQLAAGHRREVIEDLLDINVFSKMNQILRDKQSVLKDQLKELSYKIDITKNKLETQEKYIKDIQKLTQENKKEYESRIHESQNSIGELQKQNSELSMGLEESIRETEKRLSTLHDQRQELLLRSQDRQTRMRRVPYVTRPFQTTINLMYWKRSKGRDGLTRVRSSRSDRKARSWKRRLRRQDAYLNRYDLRYLNSVRTTSRSLDSQNKLKNTSHISRKM